MSAPTCGNGSPATTTTPIRRSGAGTTSGSHPAFAHWSIEGEIGSISCPLLAMQGIDDEYGTLQQIRAIARRVPRAVLVELPQCGHSPHRDQPESVIDEVTRFVDAHAVTTKSLPAHQPAA